MHCLQPALFQYGDKSLGSSDYPIKLAIQPHDSILFSHCRYFCVNDVFLLKLSPHERQGDAQILMKIVKINGSNQTTSTYRVNRQTTLFEVCISIYLKIEGSLTCTKIMMYGGKYNNDKGDSYGIKMHIQQRSSIIQFACILSCPSP